jgi:hypothetical protein
MPAVSSGPATQVTCSGSADQRFTLTQRAVTQLLTFTCSNIGSGANRSVQYDWTASYPAGPYTLNSKPSSGSTWTLVGTSSGTSLDFASPVGAPFTGATGTYDVQILNANGDQVGASQITVFAMNATHNYARC